jgi:hypothetical protein
MYIVFSFTFISVLSRHSSMTPLNGAPRYIYIQSLAFTVLFVLLIAHFVRESSQWRKVAFVGVIAWYIALNFQTGAYLFFDKAAQAQTHYQSPYRQSSAGNGDIVREFFTALMRIEEERGSRSGIFLSVDKPADWPIVVDTRDRAGVIRIGD